jgi:hypothetical protein
MNRYHYVLDEDGDYIEGPNGSRWLIPGTEFE